MSGWIKLHRSLTDNPYMRKPAYRSVWIELLLMACHVPHDVIYKGERRTLNPGQVTCGAYQLSKRIGVPRGTVERIIKTLKNEEQIEVETDSQCSLITIKNWHKYQVGEEASEERVRNDRGTSEERVRTKEECKNERMKEILSVGKKPTEKKQKGNPLLKKHYSQWTDEEKDEHRVHFLIRAFCDLWQEQYEVPPKFAWDKLSKQVKEFASDKNYGITRVILPYYFGCDDRFYVENKHQPNIFFSNNTFSKLAADLRQSNNPDLIKALTHAKNPH